MLLMMILPAYYFNSHAHVERDDKRILIDGGLCDFNSHAHVERDNSNRVALVK